MSETQTMQFDRADGIIALDWGTSSLRVWRLSRSGEILEARREDWGIMYLPEGGFPAAFAAITRNWSAPERPVPAIACGMVGSRQGWREVPYVKTPAGLAELSAGLLAVHAGPGQTLHLVPGVLEASDPEAPDVMRGEETQVVGALARLGGDALLVMPGTHSKWARLQDERLVSFRTTMTGELFALLSRHSILGRGQAEAPVAGDAARQAAFRRGVQAAHANGALARLFQTRALTLTGELELGCALDYLSGLLIGEELRLATPQIEAAARYAQAFAAFGANQPEPIADTALDGLRRVAIQAGLLPAAALDGAA